MPRVIASAKHSRPGVNVNKILALMLMQRGMKTDCVIVKLDLKYFQDQSTTFVFCPLVIERISLETIRLIAYVEVDSESILAILVALTLPVKILTP
jgi:hypothetical protein